jgi:putative acetyltransferase
LVKICKIEPNRPEVFDLIERLDAYQRELYPSESNHLDSISRLSGPDVFFVGAYMAEKLVGIGAVKRFKDYGELKRMFVLPEERGKGIALNILQALEWHLREMGVTLSRLETGIHQGEALALYHKSGYVECDPFADYEEDPRSLFMEKSLLKYTLRQAVEADFEFVKTLHHETLREYVEPLWGWDEVVQDQQVREIFKPQEFKIMEIDRREIGILVTEHGKEEVVLASISIIPILQGMGIGTKVIKEVLRIAREKGLTVSLAVLKTNSSAKKLYERLGFKSTGETESHWQMRCL